MLVFSGFINSRADNKLISFSRHCGMATRSDLRKQPQHGDAIFSAFLVEHEEIRTTSFVTSDPIDGLSYINLPENQKSSDEDDVILYQFDDTLVELEPRSLQHCLDGKRRKTESDDASQLAASENVKYVQERNELAEKQDDENSELGNPSAAKNCRTIAEQERVHLWNSDPAGSGIILTRFSAEALEQDRVLMMAKRGQAISKHSLAERIRRERITERMKVLQGLVPGCNKINGKALMLDEIINYVLSLQYQVEFLSMKLAAVDRSEQAGNGQYER